MAETERTALSKALAMPEIVQLVLLHSDMRTILTGAQRTCRFWNNVIQEFPSIQKHLFFTPIEEGDVKKIPNPLLAELFPSFFFRERTRFTNESLDMVKNTHKAAAYLREEASWRRMLVQQPPANGLALIQLCKVDGDGDPDAPSHKILVCLEPS